MTPQDEAFIPKLREEILNRKTLILWHLEHGNAGIAKDLASKTVTQREILHTVGGSTTEGADNV